MLDISQLVDGIQVLGSLFLGLSTGQESDSWDGWWDCSGESSHGEVSDLLWVSLNLGLSTGGDHVWLKEHTLEDDVLSDQLVHDGVEHFLRDSCTGLDIMLTISEDLWLNNWDESGMLADLGVSAERVGGLSDSDRRWAAIWGDLQDSSPLGESSSHLVVLLASLRKAIESHCDGLVVGSLNDGNTSIDLDSSENTLIGKDLGQRSSIGSLLSNGLIVHDGSADVILEAWNGIEELTIVISVLLSVLNVNCFKSLTTCSI